jgi:hypothetical protein
MKTQTVFFVVASTCLGACATHHQTIVSPEGRVQQRIVCRADTPGKCVKRAAEVCGEYTVVQAPHELRGSEPRQLEMVVECRLPMAASSSVAASTPAPPPPPADPTPPADPPATSPPQPQ